MKTRGHISEDMFRDVWHLAFPRLHLRILHVAALHKTVIHNCLPLCHFTLCYRLWSWRLTQIKLENLNANKSFFKYDVGKKYVEYPTTCTTSKDHLTLRLQGKMFDQNMNTNSGCATAQAARRRHPTARNIFGY